MITLTNVNFEENISIKSFHDIFKSKLTILDGINALFNVNLNISIMNISENINGNLLLLLIEIFIFS